MAKLAEAPLELRERIARAARAMGTGAEVVGASKQDVLNAAAVLLVAGAIHEKVSFGEVLVMLRSNWTALQGPPIASGDAAAAARQAGFDDLAKALEGELGPARPVRELRDGLRHMRTKRGG